jgi:transposase-like protein
MSDATSEERAVSKADVWRERLAEQARSGLSVKQFCEEHGLTQCSFYAWRKRLRQDGPVRFALVDRGAAQQQTAAGAGLELVFPTGERLRISGGVDAGTLRLVVAALRG